MEFLKDLSLVHYFSISIYFLYLNYPTIDYHSYADDMQLHCRLIYPNNDIHVLNNMHTDIHNWLTNNSLSLICLNTESLHIKISTTIFLPPQITIINFSISYANNVKQSWYINRSNTTISHSY